MSTPQDHLDSSDPGDEVSLRFHYQHCVAAINSLFLLDEKSEIRAVICENHEDFVISLANGTFYGVQVKTRALTQDSFKATDEQIIKAFSRFVNLDVQFPGKFTRFEFVTNHSFWETSENEKNVIFILKKLAERGSLKGLRANNPIKKFAQSICDKTGKKLAEVEAVLLRCYLTQKLDTVRSIRKEVISAVGELPGIATHSHATVIMIADRIINLACKASMRVTEGPTMQLHKIGDCLEDVLSKQILQNKIIEREKVQTIFDDCCSADVSFEQLYSEDKVSPDDFPKDIAIMIQKLDRGGIHTARITKISDLVRSVETTYMRWVMKLGADTANNKLQDLFSIVEFDCTEAFVKHENHKETFGSEMFEELKSTFATRCNDDPTKVYQCRPEHLLGAAGMLTQDCKVWWSEKFELVDESV